MILKFLQKNGSGKKQALEQHPKIRTFSRAQEYSAAAAKSVEDTAVSSQAPSPQIVRNQDSSLPSAGKIHAWPSASVPESIGMQDTMWTDSRYLIHFMNDDGSLLHTCEVSAGEMPAFHGETPSKPQDTNFTYTFAGWEPEIRPADADCTYTAVFSAEELRQHEAIPAPSDSDMDGHTAEDEEVSPEIFVPDEPSVSEQTPLTEQTPVSEDVPETEDFTEAPESIKTEDTPFDYILPSREEASDSSHAAPEWDFLSAYRSEMEDELTEPGTGALPAGRLLPVLKSTGKTSLEASWKPMAYIDGYDVFFAQCGTDFDGVYCTLSPDETSVSFEGLEKKSIYKLRVRPFTMNDGEKIYVGKSYVQRSITGDSSGKYTNTRKIRIRKNSLSLISGDRKKLKASLLGQKAEKKVLTHGRELRYLSDDPSVATVSKRGKVRGIGTGSCRITLVAPNGIHCSLPVSVHREIPDIAFKKKKYHLAAGEKINLRKKLKNVPDESILLKWKSSDRDIAYVSDKGIVTGLKEGNSTVRVRASGDAKAKVKVRVDRDELDLYPWESISITKRQKK